MNYLARELIGVCALAALVVPAILWDETVPFPGIRALIPCMGAAVLIWVTEGSDLLVGKALSVKPVVFLGLISYSLYLWHWPVKVFDEYWSTADASLARRLTLGLVSIVLAVISWNWVERSFRRRTGVSDGKWVTAGCLVLIGLSFVGATFVVANGFPSRVPTDAIAFANGSQDAPLYRSLPPSELVLGNVPSIGEKNHGPIDLLVWGDSHAMMYEPILSELANHHKYRVAAIHYAATPPLVEFIPKNRYSLGRRTPDYSENALRYIKENSVKNVMLIAAWHGYIEDREAMSAQEIEESQRAFTTSLSKTIQSLRSLDVKIWLVHDIPSYKFNVCKKLAFNAMFGISIEGSQLNVGEYYSRTAFERELFESLKDEQIKVIDPSPLLVVNDKYDLQRDGKPLYTDNNHLSLKGSAIFTEFFDAHVFSQLPVEALNGR